MPNEPDTYARLARNLHPRVSEARFVGRNPQARVTGRARAMLLEKPTGQRAGATPAASDLSRSVPGPPGEAGLRAFVRAHQVCWEVTPRFERRVGERMKVGYQVFLYGRHPHGLAADPDAVESRRLQRGLAALARHVSPAGALEGVVCRLAARPARLVLRPENEWTPEVEARVEVLQGAATFAEANEAQKQCLLAIEARLAALGARERRWGGAR